MTNSLGAYETLHSVYDPLKMCQSAQNLTLILKNVFTSNFEMNFEGITNFEHKLKTATHSNQVHNTLAEYKKAHIKKRNTQIDVAPLIGLLI